jgi:hypothetical protein
LNFGFAFELLCSQKFDAELKFIKQRLN